MRLANRKRIVVRIPIKNVLKTGLNEWTTKLLKIYKQKLVSLLNSFEWIFESNKIFVWLHCFRNFLEIHQKKLLRNYEARHRKSRFQYRTMSRHKKIARNKFFLLFLAWRNRKMIFNEKVKNKVKKEI